MLLINFIVEHFIFNGSVENLIVIKFADLVGSKADDPKGYLYYCQLSSFNHSEGQESHP